MPRKEIVTGVLALAIVAAVGYLWFAPPAREPAPAVRMDMLEGGQLELASLQGQPVLLQFWATTCVTCVAEMPELVHLHEDFADQGLAMVGVAMPYDPPEQVRTMVAEKGLPYRIALDRSGEVTQAFGDVRLTPTTVLIDPQGRVVWQRVGLLDFERLREEIRGMLPAGDTA
ncbi:TlpA disulfide reductase family protein [Spiribacter halobius]|uniref:TlpA family protein disulfide reductase n=1 Tax=Sediminicurvatus halobius TaxID=2182432 RepID=A0A2U2N0Z6_9GAMM|nr:TlpA disulfide reductase family protein [Spiribacter halobius]PWG62742.1 TlpA family protein disulfide reductase [Spiribacter halobius]UEX77411.1 redoxin family protein [Spiribacter halobius]